MNLYFAKRVYPTRKVKVTDCNGVVEQFESVRLASEALHCTPQYIYLGLRTGRLVRGCKVEDGDWWYLNIADSRIGWTNAALTTMLLRLTHSSMRHLPTLTGREGMLLRSHCQRGWRLIVSHSFCKMSHPKKDTRSWARWRAHWLRTRTTWYACQEVKARLHL